MESRNFESLPAAEDLRPFVRRYLYANRLLDADLTIQAKPTGYTYFSSFFGGNEGDRWVVDGRAFERTSRWFFFGRITDHDVVFHHARSLRLIVAELSATGAHRLFGIPGQRVLGMAASLREAAPGSAELARKCLVLGPDASSEAHVEESNGFFRRLAGNALPEDPFVERAVSLIESENGAVRIAKVCDRVGIGPRDLHRRFIRIVGVPPKLFARIVQINWVVALLYADDTPALARIAQEAGFYDQAHFNHAMQRFFQEGAREFLHGDHPAFRSFLAASRRFGPGS
ncbi:helix-turn-helix domain-containing protein [Lysobacter sp. F6437]|uniref:helix-turn-helix domain-containing protein n=1 Tax=Lysobacter sp. F6437 TaxID=3459296 RepID=UPI00403D7AA7